MARARVTVLPTDADAGKAAANEIEELLARHPRAVLGIATGSSPLHLYAELARKVRRGDLDLSATRAFALDEYLGLDPAHPQSFHSVIARDVVAPLQMDPQIVEVPPGNATDMTSAATAYEEAIAAAGPVRAQILGIGANGHIAFNEPGSSRHSRTRTVRLRPETRRANSRFFDSPSDVPTYAITQGIATIMDAAALVLVAHGKIKAEAVASALTGPRTPSVPASFLQDHPDLRVFLDVAAAARLVPHRIS